ncbi:hypothetical protein SAMN05216188_110177 [Lentzea xinjiangensis]|uniref:Uncharacterized protein n=1 Tax=Lentzea xinjiangensis TaxID=402600 RepID=A0A1H9NF36_9PSEU|nr:hypothetical protein SAMN05216188_110177 [Lentzea xinjiangensis]
MAAGEAVVQFLRDSGTSGRDEANSSSNAHKRRRALILVQPSLNKPPGRLLPAYEHKIECLKQHD